MGTSYPDIDIPDTDIWELLFEGDTNFSTDKGLFHRVKCFQARYNTNANHSYIP